MLKSKLTAPHALLRWTDRRQIQREFDHTLILDESFQSCFVNESILMFLCKTTTSLKINELCDLTDRYFALRKCFSHFSTNCYLDVRIFSFLMLEFTVTLNLMCLTYINFHQRDLFYSVDGVVFTPTFRKDSDEVFFFV